MSKNISKDGIGKCVNCGHLFVAGYNAQGEKYIQGANKCRKCGSTDYEILNLEDIGPVD